MKRYLLLVLLLLTLPAHTQSAESMKYAPRSIMLVEAGSEGVMPMVFTVSGQEHMEFIPVSGIKEAMVERGGKPLAFSDVLSALNEATTKIAQLQAENDKLWKVAMKDAPQPAPVVVEAPSAPQPVTTQADIDAQQRAMEFQQKQQALQMWMMLQNQNRPQNYNINISNCTRLPALCVR